MKSEINVVVTGLSWMGSGIGSIESAMDHIFRIARDEITLTVYAISSNDVLFDWLEQALSRGVLIRMILNNANKQRTEVSSRLRSLVIRYPHFHIMNFTPGPESDLHAKVIVADRQVALVGSSNLSHRGLLTNYELAVRIEGHAAETIAQTLDRLIRGQEVNEIFWTLEE